MKPSRIERGKPLQGVCNTPGEKPRAGGSNALLAEGKIETGAEHPSTGRLEEMLTARGVRITAQRRAILAAIDAFPQCRNAGMIQRRARRLDRRIHRVTVYRTLALLKRHGIFDAEGGGFNCPGREHCENAAFCDRLHVRCLGCGKVIEMGDCLLEDLTRCVERDCQFRVARAKLEIEGFCQSCRT